MRNLQEVSAQANMPVKKVGPAKGFWHEQLVDMIMKNPEATAKSIAFKELRIRELEEKLRSMDNNDPDKKFQKELLEINRQSLHDIREIEAASHFRNSTI